LRARPAAVRPRIPSTTAAYTMLRLLRESAAPEYRELAEFQQPPRGRPKDHLALVRAEPFNALDPFDRIIGAHVERHVAPQHDVVRADRVDQQVRDAVVVDQAVDVDSRDVLPRCTRAMDPRLIPNFVPVLPPTEQRREAAA